MQETTNAEIGGFESRYRNEIRFIITGADGFVGRCIATQLLGLGYSVCGLVEDRKQTVPLDRKSVV